MSKRLERDVQHVAYRLWKALDTPRSLACFMLAEAGEWDQLVSLKVDPKHYLTSPQGLSALRRDLQATEFLRKADFIPTSFATKDEAVNGFWACEKQCHLTNLRLSAHLDHPVLSTKLMAAADQRLRIARSWVKKVLGGLPCRLEGRFGPGATFESSDWGRRLVVAYDKMRNPPTLTPAASELFDHFVRGTVLQKLWVGSHGTQTLSRGNRFTTVRKDATKDRGICIEPGFNVFAQLGVGRSIRDKLRMAGIVLNPRSSADVDGWLARSPTNAPHVDKGPIRAHGKHWCDPGLSTRIFFSVEPGGKALHRRIAMESSVTDDFATIDLSNASDTVAKKLVEILLPADWFSLLSMLRSPMTKIRVKNPKSGKMESKWVYLEKFSSMGNGFTFELETLIFCALARSVGCTPGADCFVYGDDMIVPKDRAADVLAMLRYCGFTPNLRKTFTRGPFRESCGGDYFNGHDVRPFYLKEYPREPADWFVLHNGLWRVSRKFGLDLGPVLKGILDNLPAALRRLRGPDVFGDCVILDDDRSTWWTRYDSKTQSSQLRTLQPHTKRVSARELRLEAFLMGYDSSLSPRGAVMGYRRKWLYLPW